MGNAVGPGDGDRVGRAVGKGVGEAVGGKVNVETPLNRTSLRLTGPL